MHELPQDKALEFIKTKKYGNLALCGRNQPYCIPIAYTHTDAALLLYQSSRGRALKYLEENQRACFEIHDINDFRDLSLIHISEPTRRTPISYAVFCLKKKKNAQR